MRAGAETCWALCLLLGLALVGLSLAAHFYLLPLYIRRAVAGELVMRPEGPQRDQDFFILKQVWVYNCTNAREVWRRGELPRFAEVGPFAYRTYMRHKNVSFSPDGRRVRMKTDRVFHYDRAHSCAQCTEDLPLTVPNLLLFTIYGKIRPLPSWIRRQAAKFFRFLRAKPFVTATAGGLLFDGYDEILIKMLREPFMRGIIDSVPDKIGYFSGINATNAGFFTYHTGLDDIEQVGQILSWRNATSLPESFWESAEARLIRGSSGGRFKPFLAEDDVLWAFLSDICRSVYFTFERRFEVRGLSALQFAIPRDAFDWERPENVGFCNSDSDLRFFRQQPLSCLPTGLMDLSRCKAAAPPSAASMPHFLYTPAYVHGQFPSISPPDPERHRSFVVLEETTGVPINLQLKFQINIATFHDPDFAVLRNLNTTIVPVLWINQTASMDEGTRDLLLNKVYGTRRIADYLVLGLGILGLLLALIGLIGWIVAGTRRARQVKYTPARRV